MLKKLLCNLFHRRNWISFDNRKWILNHKFPYLVICMICGRSFKKNRRLKQEEMIVYIALKEILNDLDYTVNEDARIEDEIVDIELDKKRSMDV